MIPPPCSRIPWTCFLTSSPRTWLAPGEQEKHLPSFEAATRFSLTGLLFGAQLRDSLKLKDYVR
jgi:hypothetical protein